MCVEQSRLLDDRPVGFCKGPPRRRKVARGACARVPRPRSATDEARPGFAGRNRGEAGARLRTRGFGSGMRRGAALASHFGRPRSRSGAQHVDEPTRLGMYDLELHSSVECPTGSIVRQTSHSAWSVANRSRCRSVRTADRGRCRRGRLPRSGSPIRAAVIERGCEAAFGEHATPSRWPGSGHRTSGDTSMMWSLPLSGRVVDRTCTSPSPRRRTGAKASPASPAGITRWTMVRSRGPAMSHDRSMRVPCWT